MVEGLLRKLDGQVDKVVAVDNTPGSCAALQGLLEASAVPATYIPLWDNRGIGEAQNTGIRESIKCGCSHVLLLDEDSKPLPDMVSNLVIAERELVKAGKKIAAVGPRYVDEKT